MRFNGAAELALAIHNLNHGSAIIRSVRAAMARLSDGSYGTCLRREYDISPKRLNVVGGWLTASNVRLRPIREEPKGE